MNLESLNKWLTLSANIGVLAGIAFLGIELQQNTSMMRAQTRDSINQNTNQAYALISSDMALAELIIEGNMGNLEPNLNAEWITYQSFMSMGFRNWENEYYQYQQGLFETEEFEPRYDAWRRYMLIPGARQAWERVRVDYSGNFRQILDDIVSEIES